MPILPEIPALIGDRPAAAYSGALADRRELALISVERTRMPMVVSHARLPDNPIVLANAAFLELTGYSGDEVIGRNCRFLQGADTDPAAVDRIRAAIAAEQEVTVELLNYRKDGSSFWNELFISPVRDEANGLRYFFASSKDVSKRRLATELEREEHRLLLEIDHRAKNALALVQGIVRLTRAENPDAYASSVQSRVDSLARAHSILAAQGWRDVPFDRLVHAQAEPFGGRRVVASGPHVALGSRQVQPLGLFLHELLLNATQHGALSSEQGQVTVDWDQPDQHIVLDWRERGGPPPRDERPRNFGLALIEQTIVRQMKGTAAFDWRPSGLEAHFSIPLAA